MCHPGVPARATKRGPASVATAYHYNHLLNSNSLPISHACCAIIFCASSTQHSPPTAWCCECPCSATTVRLCFQHQGFPCMMNRYGIHFYTPEQNHLGNTKGISNVHHHAPDNLRRGWATQQLQQQLPTTHALGYLRDLMQPTIQPQSNSEVRLAVHASRCRRARWRRL